MIIIRTEKWNVRGNEVIKAVARDNQGRIVGATNQTAAIQPQIVGKK